MTIDPAMRNEWWVKRSDALGYVTEQLLDDAGDPFDITSADSVTFLMKRPTDAEAKVNAAAEVLDASTGIVRYAWTGTDTDTAGDFYQEWQVNYTVGGPLTFPNDGYNVIHVLKDLGS